MQYLQKPRKFEVFCIFNHLNVTFHENKKNSEHLNVKFCIFFVSQYLLYLGLKNLTFIRVTHNFQYHFRTRRKIICKKQKWIYVPYHIFDVPQNETSEKLHYLKIWHILIDTLVF